jgi:hypothetical protein
MGLSSHQESNLAFQWLVSDPHDGVDPDRLVFCRPVQAKPPDELAGPPCEYLTGTLSPSVLRQLVIDGFGEG